MEQEKNMEKYERYKAMCGNLSRAMKAGFYYEAIFIEYAIMEDRLTDLLKSAGVEYRRTRKDGTETDIDIESKLNKAKDNPKFANNKFVRERITPEFIEKVRSWKDRRNPLVHKLLEVPYDSESARKFAEEGKELSDIMKNRWTSVIKRFKKETGAK